MDLKPALRKKFEKDQYWAVWTTQQMTQNSISAYLDEHAGTGYGPKEIKYYGKPLDIYFVPFSVVEYLVDNQAAQGFKFVIYHDVKKDDFWVKWREEKRTEWEKAKAATRDGLLMRGARSFRQRSKRKKLPL